MARCLQHLSKVGGYNLAQRTQTLNWRPSYASLAPNMNQKPLPQNPAPVPFAPSALLDWYDVHARVLPWRIPPAAHKRGERADPYRVWLSEIMLQQTTVVAVKAYYEKFVRLWPHVEDLANASLEDVRAAWAGLGYYSRARNLHRAAQLVAFERQGQFPASAESLRELPGVGPYTAAAIAAICFDEPVAVLDGNVERVMARYMALERPVRDAKPVLRAAVEAIVPAQRAGDFAQAMMDLGATVCAPRRADCTRCPIQSQCLGTRSNDPTRFPISSPRRQRPEKFGHAFILENSEGLVLLRKRTEAGILAGMTGVPETQWCDERQDMVPPCTAEWRQLGTVSHVFTHLKLELTVWRARLDASTMTDTEGWWCPKEKLHAEALPSLYKKVLALESGTNL